MHGSTKVIRTITKSQEEKSINNDNVWNVRSGFDSDIQIFGISEVIFYELVSACSVSMNCQNNRVNGGYCIFDPTVS